MMSIGKKGQRLQQRQEQRLSPQQMLTIKMLELPALDLHNYIMHELEENPALEMDSSTSENASIEEETEESFASEDQPNRESDHDDPEAFLPPEELEDYYSWQGRRASDEEGPRREPRVQSTLHDHLLEQLHLIDLPEDKKQVAEFLIWNIDDDGYLRQPLKNIVLDLYLTHGISVSESELEELLKHLQEVLDPAGVGARNPQEAIMIQLNRLDDSEEAVQLAKKIVDKHFDDLVKHRFDKLKEKLRVDEELLKEAMGIIRMTNPKPAAAFRGVSRDAVTQVNPDFIVRIEEDKPRVMLNKFYEPKLRISESILRMYEEYKRRAKEDPEAAKTLEFLKKKIDRARWFRDSLLEREKTLRKIMEAIVKKQQEFVMTGDRSTLQPLTMKDISLETGYDISTVSRVANSKYVQTPFGIFSVKDFFTHAVKGKDGQSISVDRVKQRLKELINSEDKKKPYTDEELARRLKEMGINIARRTVAKYREQMGIPPARQRREV
ncbi:MAG: RNA polymerase factor sigma-54 [Chlorobi bacterium]|nr:RNA polymerase factor sigma-54 [Chlorobiota bacterium]